MDELIKYLIAGCAGGGVGGGGIGAFLFFLLKRHLARRDALEQKLEQEKAEKLERVEKKIDDHLFADNPGKTDERLDKLSGEVMRLSHALERDRESMQRDMRSIDRTLGTLDGTLGGINKWLANMNEAVQKHITDGGIHGGK